MKVTRRLKVTRKCPAFLLFMFAILLANCCPEAQCQADKPQEGLVETPIVQTMHGYIVVLGTVNKTTPVRFLLDLGTTRSCIGVQLAEKLKLKLEPAIGADGKPFLANGVPFNGVTLDSGAAVFGGLMLGGQFAVVKMDFLNDLDGAFDGILGLDVFVNGALAIYPAKKVMKIYPSGGLSSDSLKAAGFGPSAHRLPIFQNTQTGVWDCTVSLSNGKAKSKATLIFDTGCDVTRIPDKVSEALHLEELHSVDTQMFGRQFMEYQGVVSSITVGDVDVPNLTVDFSHAQPEPPSCLGMDVLRNYSLLIDFPAATVYLSPAITASKK